MKVIYTGTADVQKFGKTDFAKAGVEHDAVTFKRDEPTEVSDELGTLLISNSSSESPIFSSYKFKEAEEEDSGDTVNEKPKKKASSGSSQQQDVTPGSAGNTGSGTSTS